MSDPYLGEIRNFGFNFAPVGWLQCQGQLLPISQYNALFALLGITYGGNGTQTFGLPDLRGRVPVGAGTGAGLAPITQGQVGGQNSVTINSMQLPAHTHAATFTPSGGGGTPTVNVSVVAGSGAAVAGTTTPFLAASTSAGTAHASLYASSANGSTQTLGGVSASISGVPTGGGTVAVALTGGNLPIPTEPPFLGSNWCIATEGIFPSRP